MAKSGLGSAPGGGKGALAGKSPEHVRSVLLRQNKVGRRWYTDPGTLGGLFLVGYAFVWLWQFFSSPSDYRQVLPVDILDARDPDFMKIFYDKYHDRLPVVIEGVLDTWPAMQWSIAALTRKCPKAELPVYTFTTKGKDWAALQDAGQFLLSEYWRDWFGLEAPKDKKEEKEFRKERPYGLEMSMRNECPALLEDVRIPAPFSDDMLMKYYKKGAWPTLITGPVGTRSGLHRDSHNFAFWMALFVGSKHWRVFLEGEPALQEHYKSKSNSFEFDPFSPDFRLLPSLGKATVYDHVLMPGQLIYIPTGAPHAAKNVEDSIAISGNYLDGRSLKRHMEGTCQQPLWTESKLCWAYNDEFYKHKVPAVQDMKELSYFEFAGFTGAADWCKTFLPELKGRAEKRPEYKRPIKIVEEYCAAAENQCGDNNASCSARYT